MHEHTHTHTHSHDHDHHHDHDHDHSHAPTDKNTAVLKYMLDHNRHHAEELRALAQTLREAGKTEAADTLCEAVADFDAGNEKLEATLVFLGGE